MNRPLPSLAEAKAEARALRQQRAAAGEALSHSAALERIAALYGYRDWNALHAALATDPACRWRVGDRVSGRYLGCAFRARILRVTPGQPGWAQLDLDLEQPIDVVRFESFSNLRKRLRIEVGPAGHSRARTSDGQPQARLDL